MNVCLRGLKMAEYIKREAVSQVLQGIANGLLVGETEALKAKDMKSLLKIKAAKEILKTVDNDLCFIPTADVQPTDKWINAQTNPSIATDGETSDYVLVLRKSGRQCVCYYVYDDGGNYWCSEDEKSMYAIDEVTHWQPLPETPETKKG